jgi:hypothetical protein
MVVSYLKNKIYNLNYNYMNCNFINNKLNARKKLNERLYNNIKFNAIISEKKFNDSHYNVDINVFISDNNNTNIKEALNSQNSIDNQYNIVNISLDIINTKDAFNDYDIPFYSWVKSEQLTVRINRFNAISPNKMKLLDKNNKQLFKYIGKEVLNGICVYISYKYNLSPNTPVILQACTVSISASEIEKLENIEYHNISTEDIYLNNYKANYDNNYDLEYIQNDNHLKSYYNLKITRHNIIKNIKNQEIREKLISYYKSFGFEILKEYPPYYDIMGNTLDKLINNTKN